MAAEAVLSVVLKQLLSKLSSLVQNEIGLLWGLEEEKQKLGSNLSVIRAVLHDAEKRQVNEMAVKDWLEKLKGAAYDAEDLVDEFIFEARRRKVVNQQGLPKKVRNFCSLSNPLAFRLKMAHKMQELRKRFDGIAKERNDFHFKVEVVESGPPISRKRETCSYVIQSDVCGRENEAEELIPSLINSENEEVLSVISIVGMGGLGKTTLAQLIYNDERVGTHFDLKMWVYVSEDFDVGRLLKEIVQSATKDEVGNLSIDLLHARLRETLSGKKYLLVLDDVWNEEVNEWSKLKTWLKCGGMGSKILATTRSDKVAAIMGTLPAHKLGILSEEDSWTLFETLARPHPNFVSMGKEMVGKCGGLPLAIKTLGGLMSSKTTQSEWESLRNSEFWKPQDDGGGILPALRLSYDHLAPSLKQCFAYCAIIPKGCNVYKDNLVRQWIAQGFIHSDGENDLLEEKGEGYFNELQQRSLFHVGAKTYDLEEPHYNMHDLIHDLLRFIVGAEYSIVEASKKIDPSTEIRHLASRGLNEQRESKILEALEICKKLRTVSLPFYSFDVTVLSRFRRLRVLDSSGNKIRYLPNSIDKLKHLRYLDISFTSIRELPESICNLHSLQTLKLGYEIKNLPKNIKKMISLRHVEFHQDYPAPKGIGELTCLRIWTTFVVSKDNGAGIEELKGLNQLSGHIHIKGLDNIRNDVCAREANLKDKQYLSALELSWSYVAGNEGNSKEVIENLQPHPNLKNLTINQYRGLNFPGWMMMLTNLVDIKLSGCNRCEHLPPLWQLPLLESLDIKFMRDLKYIVEFDGDHNCKDVFPSLKRLHLSRMPNLEEWSSSQAPDGGTPGKERDQQVILKSLRNLLIRRCQKLIQLPWLRLLPSLEYLEIGGVGWDAIEMPTSPSSLIKLVVDNMPNLERWSPQEADGDEGNQVIFHSLGTLKINECPKLVCLPGVLLSAPREADHEQVTFPQLMELEVNDCPRIVHFPHLLPSLKILSVAAINQMLLGLVANYTSLTELSIGAFPEVKCLSNQLENLHALKTLVIDGCTDPVLSLPDWAGLQHHQQQQSPPPLISLEKLEISNSCEKQTSLPGEEIVLTSLKELRIDSCKNIESLSDDMLRSLTRLEIDDCPKVFSFLSLSLENLKSLKRLKISRCPDVMNLLQHAESLTSLTSLSIFNCPGMSSLPESMRDLSSLTDLYISECPEIRTLPEGLQRLTNLQTLRIFQCPILKRRLQCNEGQDWHKVAHVPYIWIDFENPRDSLSSVGHPSLMHSLKMGCNRFNTKKLLLPSSCSSSSSPPRT
ncbi:putative disease resistance protein RGA4 [Cinnamomum micranthum f. kanehirae]|uniref:Putative disease resistance protein RGA4 n=1 Tax=Cinnamomum micranthum f. kanehirae TaxID=337451 RepID=A0A443PQL4_9MAGN|nr:putative disease resistance protein RGA4 [Cinnamomum micranthum f. kanehirae]